MSNRTRTEQAARGVSRYALLAGRAFVLPFFFLTMLLLFPFAWAVDRIETRLYGLSRTASVNR